MVKPELTFDKFMTREFDVWEIKVHNEANEDNWNEKKIICDCPKFQKNFICKHSIGIAVRLNMAKVTQDAKYALTQIGKLPKRGRPPKAVKALIRM